MGGPKHTRVRDAYRQITKLAFMPWFCRVRVPDLFKYAVLKNRH